MNLQYLHHKAKRQNKEIKENSQFSSGMDGVPGMMWERCRIRGNTGVRYE